MRILLRKVMMLLNHLRLLNQQQWPSYYNVSHEDVWLMSPVLQESTATSEPRWGGRRSSAAGRKAPRTSRMCLTSRGKWDRKYSCRKYGKRRCTCVNLKLLKLASRCFFASILPIEPLFWKKLQGQLLRALLSDANETHGRCSFMIGTFNLWWVLSYRFDCHVRVLSGCCTPQHTKMLFRQQITADSLCHTQKIFNGTRTETPVVDGSWQLGTTVCESWLCQMQADSAEVDENALTTFKSQHGLTKSSFRASCSFNFWCTFRCHR